MWIGCFIITGVDVVDDGLDDEEDEGGRNLGWSEKWVDGEFSMLGRGGVS